MAGITSDTAEFKQIVSPFLQKKLDLAADSRSCASSTYKALAKQYLISMEENNVQKHEKRRHYEAEITNMFLGGPLLGVERLYRRTVLVEPTTACFAHCRYCARARYPVHMMDKNDLTRAAQYIGSSALASEVNEIIITGGDPLVALPLVKYFINELTGYAPNVRIIRIHTRALFHSPDIIDNNMLKFFESIARDFILEIGTQINHPIEFWPESIAALNKLHDLGMIIYNQNPLLKGINDSFEVLAELYDKLRYYQVEPHYLFHAIPIYGMNHFRTTVSKGLELIQQLSSSGIFSGRAKPKYAILTDIGKIVLYDGSIIRRSQRNNMVLVHSGYALCERERWCPGWTVPNSVVVDKNGQMKVWYLDGQE